MSETMLLVGVVLMNKDVLQIIMIYGPLSATTETWTRCLNFTVFKEQVASFWVDGLRAVM